MRLHGERVLIRTTDLELRTQILRRLHHSTLHRVSAAASGDPSAGEPIDERDGLGLDTPPQARGSKLGLAHRLRAPSEDHVAGSGRDLHAGRQDRLQAGAAAPINLLPGHSDAESGVKRRNSADRRGLAARCSLTKDDIIDLGATQPRALDKLLDQTGYENMGGQVAELRIGA